MNNKQNIMVNILKKKKKRNRLANKENKLEVTSGEMRKTWVGN